MVSFFDFCENIVGRFSGMDFESEAPSTFVLVAPFVLVLRFFVTTLLVPLVVPFVCSPFSFERPILVENLRNILLGNLSIKSFKESVEELRASHERKKHTSLQSEGL